MSTRTQALLAGTAVAGGLAAARVRSAVLAGVAGVFTGWLLAVACLAS
ncbi:hypothetical protein [Dactylosporangium sp. NPDC000521]